ncbi:MAG: Mov34/MPN/PAD-1 family protein [Myxococcota bacterium]|jgi:integrative and conjugative element protein (TIGR02256 family)|nr:Mov34/MPN/PAD-1 family protein [Myxococcota bacterium]
MTEPLHFLLDTPHGLVVKLTAPVITRMRALAQHGVTDPERAGVLVGRYYPTSYRMPGSRPGWSRYLDALVVDAITEPGPRCRLERHAYELDVPHHHREAARLAALHEAGGEIVGGWHTHPQWLPVPSAQDLSEWRRVLLAEAESETTFPYRVEVIVGTVHVRAWVGVVGMPLVHAMREFDPYREDARRNQDRVAS